MEAQDQALFFFLACWRDNPKEFLPQQTNAVTPKSRGTGRALALPVLLSFPLSLSHCRAHPLARGPSLRLCLSLSLSVSVSFRRALLSSLPPSLPSLLVSTRSTSNNIDWQEDRQRCCNGCFRIKLTAVADTPGTRQPAPALQGRLQETSISSGGLGGGMFCWMLRHPRHDVHVCSQTTRKERIPAAGSWLRAAMRVMPFGTRLKTLFLLCVWLPSFSGQDFRREGREVQFEHALSGIFAALPKTADGNVRATTALHLTSEDSFCFSSLRWTVLQSFFLRGLMKIAGRTLGPICPTPPFCSTLWMAALRAQPERGNACQHRRGGKASYIWHKDVQQCNTLAPDPSV